MNLEEARRTGTKQYATGKACKYGHVCNRFTTSRQCVECSKRKQQAYYHENGGGPLAKLRRMQKAYGLSPEAYHTMWLAQGQRCALCLSDLQPGERHTDHNHKTGTVRGILCVDCNVGLGRFKDNPDALLRASRYVCR